MREKIITVFVYTMLGAGAGLFFDAAAWFAMNNGYFTLSFTRLFGFLAFGFSVLQALVSKKDNTEISS